MTTKAIIIDNRVYLDENGDVTLPVDSKLGHRFSVVDGVVVDKYNGISDNAVRIQDHEEAQERVDAAQAAWDALSDEEKEKVDRPVDLPALTLPED